MRPVKLMAVVIIIIFFVYILSFIVLRVIGVQFVPRDMGPMFISEPLYIVWEDQNGKINSLIYKMYKPLFKIIYF